MTDHEEAWVPPARPADAYTLRWTPKGATVDKLFLTVRNDGRVWFGTPLTPEEAARLGAGSLSINGDVPQEPAVLAGIDGALRAVMFLSSEVAKLRMTVRHLEERVSEAERGRRSS